MGEQRRLTPRIITRKKPAVRQLLSCLIVLAIAVVWGADRLCAQNQQTAIVVYNGDNGNYGDVTLHIDYHFSGQQVFYKVSQVIIGQSFKMKNTETELFNEVMREGLWSSSKFHSSIDGKFTAEVSFGLTKLKTASAQIAGRLNGIGKKDYTSFDEPPGADKIAFAYAQEHRSNLYTDHCSLWRFKIVSIDLYDLDRAIDDLREKRKRDKRELQRQFDSKITQASLASNLSKFDEAEARLQEAHELIKGSQERKRVYDQTKAAIEQRKKAQAQKEEQNKAAEKARRQKAEAANQKAEQARQAQAAAAENKQRQAAAAQGGQTGGGRPGQQQKPSQQASVSHPGNPMAWKKYEERQRQAAAEAQRQEAERQKAEETRRKIQQMKAQLEQTQRNAQRLDEAADQAFEGMAASGDDPIATLNAVKPLAMEFAKQGSAVGAYGSIGVGVGMGMLKMLGGNRKRKEAARAAAERERRIREQREAERKKREAERERLRREAFALMIQQRHTVLATFHQSDPIPLSTSPIAEDTIYYFLYAIDSATFEKAETKVYVSNVFAIGKYHDGTWPYQSKIGREIEQLTPLRERMQGYYVDKEQALQMRAAFVEGFQASEGVQVSEVAYRKESMEQQESAGDSPVISGDGPAGGGLGIPLGPAVRPAKKTKTRRVEGGDHKAAGLGIPLGQAPAKNQTDKQKAGRKGPDKKPPEKSKGAEGDGGLGVPIK